MIPQGALNSLNPTRKIKDLAADMILSHDEKADKKDIQRSPARSASSASA